jgi:glucose-1-phosphate cytidylyltransferase
MKVVLFCGGQGLRMRDYAHDIPKPMVTVGNRPVLWHVMKYYAHYGCKEFILCLGHYGDVIKKFFLEYDECYSNDFTLDQSNRQITLLNRDITDWRITFVDTGLESSVGERLKAVQHLLTDDPWFLANYSDGLTDCPLPAIVEHFQRENKIACFLSIPATHSFHVVDFGKDNLVSSIDHLVDANIWINGGYFALRREIFDYLNPGDELVPDAFQRLIAENQVVAYPYRGFWIGMDTFKEKQQLDDMCARGSIPWQVWREPKR